MDKLKTGLIGCGKVAELHAAALAGSERSVFSAVCSRSMEKARAFGARYGAAGYDNVTEMVRRQSLDAVVVCTPHPAHAGGAIEAMEAGAHVLTEKPLASSLADCDAMLAAAERAKVKLGVVSQRRFYEPCLRIRRAIDAGKIGRPVLGIVTLLGWRGQAYYDSDPWRGTWAAEGGGVLVNQAPHQLDLLGWYMGPVEEVFGYWGNVNHPAIEVEDTAVAAVRFAGGGLGTITVSNSQNPALYGRVQISGTSGACVGVQTDGGAMFIAGQSEIEEPPVNDCWTVPGERHLLEAWRREDAVFFKTIKATEYYHQLQVDDFLAAIAEDRDPLVTGQDGRRVVELFTAIYRCRRDRQPVRFPVRSEPDNPIFDGRLCEEK